LEAGEWTCKWQSLVTEWDGGYYSNSQWIVISSCMHPTVERSCQHNKEVWMDLGGSAPTQWDKE